MNGERPGAGSTTAGWLAVHDHDSPEELRAAVREAVREHGDSRGSSSAGHHTGLVAAAVHCLREALEIGSDRAAATPLLAADALLTYAVEAAAERGASLDDLSIRVNRMLAELLGE